MPPKLISPIIPPADLDNDSALDWSLDRFSEIESVFPVLWDPSYQADFRLILKGALQRGIEQIKTSGRLKASKKDVHITLTRVDPAKVVQRGDLRYSSEKMAEFLRDSGKDILPIVIGDTGTLHLQDGHHRLRAYKIAGMQPLALVVSVKPSTNDVPSYVIDIDSSVFHRSSSSSISESLLRQFVSEIVR